MSQARAAATPITKDVLQQLGLGDELQTSEATRVRRGIARLNFMAQDRPDLAFCSRELSKFMSAPASGTRKGLEHAMCYLRGTPRCLLAWTPAQRDQHFAVDIVTDSDWSSDTTTRKSISGGLIRFAGVTVAHWSKTQASVALSSAEAEFNAVVTGLVEGVHISNLIQELWGQAVPIRVSTDASACKGMLLRSGVGRLKHLSTKQLWAQGAIAAYGVEVLKISRKTNSADMMTPPRISGIT